MDDNDFEPYDSRNVKVTITYFAAMAHFLKGAVGTGILAMPNVFGKSGMLVGIVSMFFFGFIVTLTLQILFKCMYLACKLKKIGWLPYNECIEIALNEGPGWCKKISKFGSKMTTIIFVIYQFGIMTTYVQFVAENVKGLLNIFEINLTLEMYMIVLLIPFLLINMVRDLKVLTPFSVFANAISIGTFGFVLYYVVRGLPSFSSRDMIKNLIKFPSFFGTAFFAMHSLTVVVSLEATIDKPRNFVNWNGVLNMSMLILTILYTVFSVLGYWKYGDKSMPSITLNFPEGEIPACSAKLLYAIAIYISFGLQGLVLVDMVWAEYVFKRIEKSDYVRLWNYFVRVVIVMVSYFVAVTIPCLGPCISFTGAFCLSILGVIIPTTMDWCLHYKKLNYAVVLRVIFLYIIGFAALILGCLCAVADMIECLQS